MAIKLSFRPLCVQSVFVILVKIRVAVIRAERWLSSKAIDLYWQELFRLRPPINVAESIPVDLCGFDRIYGGSGRQLMSTKTIEIIFIFQIQIQ